MRLLLLTLLLLTACSVGGASPAAKEVVTPAEAKAVEASFIQVHDAALLHFEVAKLPTIEIGIPLELDTFAVNYVRAHGRVPQVL